MCASMDVCVGGWVSGSCYGLCCVASVFGVWLVGSCHGLCCGSSLSSLNVFTEEVEEVLGSGGAMRLRVGESRGGGVLWGDSYIVVYMPWFMLWCS